MGDIALSVCIATYRGARRVERLLRSLLPQLRFVGLDDDELHEHDIEVVIFDDGSPPADQQQLMDVVGNIGVLHRERRQERAQQIKLITAAENRGWVGAMRDAIAASSGPLVWMLDDDVTMPPYPQDEVAQTLVSLLAGFPSIGMVSWRSFGKGAGQSRRAIRGFLQPATQIAGYCAAFRREIYDKVGGLDTRFKMYCGDSDLALRIALAGHPTYRVWWPLVPHEEHGAMKDAPELDPGSLAARDLAAFQAKWGATGHEMEKRAIESLIRRADADQGETP